MSELTRLLLFPFGGNAREATVSIGAINRVEPRYDILGFFDDDGQKHGIESGGARVLGGREVLETYPDASTLAAPGSSASFRRRLELIESLGIPRERLVSIVHPSVSLAGDAYVGSNTLIMQGSTISVGVWVGDHCVILPNTVVSHDVRVGEATLIGSNVSISGGVHIGRRCYVSGQSGTGSAGASGIGTRRSPPGGANRAGAQF